MSSTRPRLGTALVLLGLPPALIGLLTLSLGSWPDVQGRHVLLAKGSSFVHYGVGAWTVALLLTAAGVLLLRRRWTALVLVPLLLGLGCQAAWLLPYATSGDRPAALGGPRLRIAMINVERGQADPAQVWQQVRRADVVVLVESGTGQLEQMRRLGLDREFPHRVGRAADRPDVDGLTIHSRHRVDDLGAGPTALGSHLVRVHHPAGDVLVAGVHPINPMSGAGPWLSDAHRLQSWLLPRAGEHLVIAGDFNAIDRHETMQPWWRAGLTTTADLTGAGLQRTWPTYGLAPVRLIGIDHVLVSRSMTATDHRVFTVDDTDHAGILTEVAYAAP